MLTSVKTTGCTLIVSQITHANVSPDQTVVYPANYRAVTLAGDDAKRMNEALKAAGFVGEGTLINPARLVAIEYADANNMKVFLDGAQRSVYMAREIEDQIFPAQKSPEHLVAEKPRRKKSEAA